MQSVAAKGDENERTWNENERISYWSSKVKKENIPVQQRTSIFSTAVLRWERGPEDK